MFPCSNITSPQGARKDAEFQSRLRVMDIDEATAGRQETPWDLLALEGEKLENLGKTIALTSIRRPILRAILLVPFPCLGYLHS